MGPRTAGQILVTIRIRVPDLDTYSDPDPDMLRRSLAEVCTDPVLHLFPFQRKTFGLLIIPAGTMPRFVL